MIPKWIRELPHPAYGNCGGGKLDCSLSGMPIDKMDECFQHHDMNLYSARQLGTEEEIKSAEKEADIILGQQLRNEKELLPYAHKFYGRIYNRFARLIFK